MSRWDNNRDERNRTIGSLLIFFAVLIMAGGGAVLSVRKEWWAWLVGIASIIISIIVLFFGIGLCITGKDNE